jgi:hypothetical protein
MFFANAFARRARHCLYIRNFNTLSSLPINPNRWIYISRSTNPLFNLVLEDWFVHLSEYSASTQPNPHGQAIQVRPSRRPITPDLPQPAMRRHWTEPESVEGDQPRAYEATRHTVVEKAQWGWDRVPCSSSLISPHLRRPLTLHVRIWAIQIFQFTCLAKLLTVTSLLRWSAELCGRLGSTHASMSGTISSWDCIR